MMSRMKRVLRGFHHKVALRLTGQHTEGTGRKMGLPPNGGCDGRGGLIGGGDLRLLPPEHSRKVYCDQANCEPVSDGKTEAGDKGGKEMVGS